MLKDYIISVNAFIKAKEILRSKRIWTSAFLPGFILLVFFVFGFYLFANNSGKILNLGLIEKIGLKQWIDSQDSGFVQFVFSFNSLVVWMVGALFYFSIFKYIWLFWSAPFLKNLSQKAFVEIYNRRPEVGEVASPVSLTLKDSVGMILYCLLWQSVLYISFLLLAILPVIGWLAPLLAFTMEAYYLGLVILGFAFRQRGVKDGAIRGILAKRRGLAIGNGLLLYLMLLVPIIGWLVAPAYSMVAAVITVKDAENS